MEKEKKGLADAEEGEFILNESGTTVSTDQVEGIDTPAKKDPELSDEKNDRQANTNPTERRE